MIKAPAFLVLLAAAASSLHLAAQSTITLPANAHRVSQGGWECNRGFRQTGNLCDVIRIPANAELDASGHEWECSRGFRQTSTSCERVQVPANAQIDTAGHSWECNRGFRQAGNVCELIIVPANARLDTLGHAWECTRGYRQVAESCVATTTEEPPSADRARPATRPLPPPASVAPPVSPRAPPAQPPPLPRQQPERAAPRQTTGAVDTRDWAACSDAVDRMKSAADDVQEQVSTADSAREDYQKCRDSANARNRGPESCARERSQYQTARDEATNLMAAMRTRYRATAQACGMAP